MSILLDILEDIVESFGEDTAESIVIYSFEEAWYERSWNWLKEKFNFSKSSRSDRKTENVRNWFDSFR